MELKIHSVISQCKSVKLEMLMLSLIHVLLFCRWTAWWAMDVQQAKLMPSASLMSNIYLRLILDTFKIFFLNSTLIFKKLIFNLTLWFSSHFKIVFNSTLCDFPTLFKTFFNYDFSPLKIDFPLVLDLQHSQHQIRVGTGSSLEELC